MIEKKQIEESSKVIIQLIKDGKIISPQPLAQKFFSEKSKTALIISKRLLDLYDEEQLDSHAWVINTAYYSMFFAATALLAKYNHKINVEQGIHRLTYHALVYYFIKQESKLKNEIMEQYKEAVAQAENLLQLSEKKIMTLVDNFNLEQEKRKTFTYELGKIAERNKALLSYERAKKFFREVEMIID